ncbi:hypothetical protein HanHA89_Chr05g0205971 [Helianthus annuus]|nr:hypothetical protein HanHA89_Chr05g0205971 [Helianthus annuus]
MLAQEEAQKACNEDAVEGLIGVCPRELFDASRSYSLQSLLEWDASANGCIYRPVWWWHVVVELS